MVYQVKCAWCGKDMGIKEAPASAMALALQAQGTKIVSHGICEACKNKTLKEIRSKDKGEAGDQHV